jgi:hypothetical protein
MDRPARRARPLADAERLGPAFTPHAEHTRLVGSNRPTVANARPY